MSTVSFILVRPQHPGNIGAAARVMANFQWTALRLVAPRVAPTDPVAMQRALGGAAILERATVYPSVMEAVHDMHLVMGTSRRMGQHRPAFQPLSSVLDRLADCAPSDNVAILFGSEEHGLHNAELDLCHTVLTVHTSPEIPSLNLGQMVGLVAYELRRTAHDAPHQPPIAALATSAEREAMYGHLAEALETIGFFPHGNPDVAMRPLRQLLGRTQLTGQEVKILRGIARQILWVSRP